MAKSLYPSRTCPACEKPNVRITNAACWMKHTDGEGNVCELGGKRLPTDELPLPPEAPECKTTPANAETQSPTPTTSSTSSEESETTTSSKSSLKPSTTTGSVTSPSATDDVTPTPSDTLPGVDEYAKALAAADEAGHERAVSKYAQPARVPESPTAYSQPAKVNPVITDARPMGDLAKQITAMLKEIFFQYTNRTGRSAQKTLGPSQIGSPCDRRIAMHLLGMPAVNPGGDNWASFVGTCIHAGLAEMLDWADADQGRFLTEVSLNFPSELVPHGTADVLDRILFMVDDHKCMGTFSLDKLKRLGPSDTYRVQLHVYGLGARMRGERIDHVALIAWPRDKANLDDLYVWTEPYDPDLARQAIKRVEDIADLALGTHGPRDDGPHPRGAEIAASFPIQDDCRYCEFYMPGAKDLRNGGCNGRQ